MKGQSSSSKDLGKTSKGFTASISPVLPQRDPSDSYKGKRTLKEWKQSDFPGSVGYGF